MSRIHHRFLVMAVIFFLYHPTANAQQVVASFKFLITASSTRTYAPQSFDPDAFTLAPDAMILLHCCTVGEKNTVPGQITNNGKRMLHWMSSSIPGKKNLHEYLLIETKNSAGIQAESAGQVYGVPSSSLTSFKK